MPVYLQIYKRKNEEGAVRRQLHEGKMNIILPVTMMVEGVHSGSQGAVFHSIDELGHVPGSWNGIPIVLNHPQKDGVNVSANSPDIIDSTVNVGRVYNTNVNGTKLCAEAWLVEEKLIEHAPAVFDAITNNTPVEVSVGVFTENEPIENGNWNEETYTHIAHNHRPDHLALLPGGRGACSLDDGCGLGVNKEKKADYTFANYSKLSLNEVLDHLRSKVDALDNDASVNYLHEVYDAYLVYETRARAEKQTKLLKQTYEIDNNNVINFVGNPIQVKRKVEYVNANEDNSMLNSNYSKKMAKKENCGQCMEKVVSIINDNIAGFSSTDREVLLEMDESVLDKILSTKKVQSIPAEPKAVTAEQILAAMSEEDRAALAYGKKQLAEKRANLIKGIQDNTSQELWPAAELNSLNENMLEKIYKSVVKETENIVDYSLNGGSRSIVNNSVNDIEPLYFLDVNVETIKK